MALKPHFYATMALSALLAAGSNLLLRHGMEAVSQEASAWVVLAAFSSWRIPLGLCGYAMSHLLWLFLLSRTQLGAAYPVFVCSLLVMVMLGSVLFLDEAMTPYRLASALLVMAGIAVSEGGGNPSASAGGSKGPSC
jgi:drug/metabolite transporter (DMT)-like permease